MAINELRSISIFVTAAELGSLRKAATAMGITPQAASQALAQLERQLDVRLFHRTTRVMSLTDEGRQFLEEARPALRGLQKALEGAKRAKEAIAGPLRIVSAHGRRSNASFGRCWRSSASDTRASCPTFSWRTGSGTGWRTGSTLASASVYRRTKASSRGGCSPCN